MSETMPRIQPIDLDQLTDEQIAVIGDKNDPRCELNLFKTLVQHPKLLKVYMPLAMQLGRSSNLPPRDREIMVLRTLSLCNEQYESAHHVHIAQQVGMSPEEIVAAREGSSTLSPAELELIAAVDELVSQHNLSDNTWRKLAVRYNVEQLIEIVFVVGSYVMGSMANNALGIQPEAAVENTWKPTHK